VRAKEYLAAAENELDWKSIYLVNIYYFKKYLFFI